MALLAELRAAAGRVRRDVLTVYYAARDPRTPRAARLLALAVAAYALSPIDLIPDFIPVLGYLDDLVLVPLGIWLVIRALPPEVLAASRARAAVVSSRPVSTAGAAAIVALWLLATAAIGYGVWRHL